MKPKADWKRPTPRMQLVDLLRAVEGDVDDMRRGIFYDEQLSRCAEHLESAQVILRDMPEGSWTPPVDLRFRRVEAGAYETRDGRVRVENRNDGKRDACWVAESVPECATLASAGSLRAVKLVLARKLRGSP